MREIIVSKEEIESICVRLGNELKERFKDSKNVPVFIGVLKGAMPFMIDLVKHCDFELEEDFIQVSSYDGTASTGVIHLKKDVSSDIKNRDVVIIEDIIDTGLTLSYLKQYLKIKYQPSSITLCTLIDKKPLRKVELEADLVGVTLKENKFLVGYGLDYYELARNIDYVFTPSKEDLKKWDKIVKEEKELLKD